ncbi:amino acid adenylation domain-containing protein [Tenacibaculum sp. MAR_2009_124]|uniref:non-ribosomal peptide synthetase n=1 Tax=Tenacibaculum sp. MAR_2009_124 TaxID=1250059 RepID=UPI0008994A7A|nr:non-ribosomal peptide synthetase [Tenacibaculum sp. MAR_2009_124]SEC23068.1 amino acid adenylation domain-containing protein [Tenacibaculum sp. MAR_2009_124]
MNSKEKLHLAQLEVYYGQLLDPKSSIYTMGGYVVLTGILDTVLFKSVVAGLSSVYDIYNFRYDFTGNEPLLYLGETKDVYLNELDFSNELSPEKNAKEWIQKEIDTAFDITQEKLYNYSLIKIAENIHWWCCYNHHLLYDGFGSSLFVSHVIEEYDRRLNSPTTIPNTYPLYFDIAKKSNDYLNSEQYDSDATYWREKFSDIPNPIINIHKKNSSTGGYRLSIPISESDKALYSRLNEKTKANLPQFTLAALLIYFGKTTPQSIFSFGVPIHNRVSREERKTLGMFSSVLPFKGTYNPDKILSEFILDLKKAQRNDFRHRQYPISHLNKHLKLLSKKRQQIFDIVINYEGFPFPKSLPSGLNVVIKNLSTVRSLEDPLLIRWCDYKENSSLILTIDFLKEYFKETEIELLSERLLFILRQFENNLTEPINDISILPEKEKKHLLEIGKGIDTTYPSHENILTLFTKQAEINPKAIAVVYKETSLSYKELDERSNQLASYLHKQGIKSDIKVGICLNRSLEMLIGILGVLKAGGAYVPIDKTLPKERIDYMIDDSNMSFVLTDKNTIHLIPVKNNLEALMLDNHWDIIEKEPLEKPTISISQNNLAYVIYTSGSTGTPKGVMITHASLIDYVYAFSNYFKITDSDVILNQASISFDTSIEEIFPILSAGGKLIIAENNKDFNAIVSLSKKHNITLLSTHPFLIDFLNTESNFDSLSLRAIISGGDVLKPSYINNIFKKIPIYNSYGPTEATVCISYYKIKTLSDTIPIGKPIDNTSLYVVDDSGNLCPKGVIGELWASGKGIAKGYLNNQILSEDKFIANPFKKGKRIYKTGDLVKWLPDGNLEFIGRKDSQVNIRGHRIELGEIESVLLSLGSIDQCCVLVKNDVNDNKHLVGYITTRNSLNKRELQEKLKTSLPNYMIPNLWVKLEEMPLTVNGKLDRKLLPNPDFSELSTKTYIAPRNEIEETLASTWQELLRIEKIGIYDNFFELGGHSLLVVKLINQLQENGFHINVKDIFSNATIAGISKNLSVIKTTYQVPTNGITENCSHITPIMVPLLNFEQEDINKIVSSIPGGVSNIQDIYPLSPLQEGIYFQYLISSKTAGDPYVTPILLSFTNKEKRASFIKALQFVINRHDVLRTCFLSEKLPKPVQVVLKEAEVLVEELTIDNSKDVFAQLQILINSGNQRLDVSQAPLIKLQLADDIENNQYYMVLLEHHLVIDHVGLEKVISEIKSYLYNEEAKLPKPYLYRNFIGHTLHQKATNNGKQFFKNLLCNIDKSTYPYQLSNIRGNGLNIEESSILLSKSLSSKIRSVSNHLKISSAALFHAAYGLVIGRLSNSDYALFGSLFSGRMQEASDGLGLYINTLPFFIELNGSISTYIQNVHQRLHQYLSFEQTPLSDIQNWSGIANDVPIFSALLNFRYTSNSSNTKNGGKILDSGVTIVDAYERTNYPFTLSIDDFGIDFGLTARVVSNINVNRVIGYIENTLDQLVTCLNSEKPTYLVDLDIIPKEETNQILTVFNNIQFDQPLNKTLIDLISDQVYKTPNSIAIAHNNITLTYKELDERSNQLARFLHNRSTSSDNLIGICLERGLDMIVGLLGILKSGAAYVPIDPDYPKDRIDYILNDANIEFILTSDHTKKILENKKGITIVSLESNWNDINTYTTNKLNKIILPNQLAYVIYTSGSTGNPKGVLIEHRTVVNLITSQRSSLNINSNEVILQLANFVFDASVEQIFISLSSGAKLVLLNKDIIIDSFKLMALIKKEQITYLHATPSFLNTFEINDKIEHLKIVISGGEVCPFELMQKWSKNYSFYNKYGPTETTVTATITLPYNTSNNNKDITIGTPIKNTQIYITNSNMKLVPIEVIGEICIGGQGVARGYLNHPELTEEKFIPNPFREGDRLYKTGDLGRWLPDGTIEFFGRKDEQVKIRGYRIELREIEKSLSSLTSVNQCCVLARQNNDSTKSLIGYVVPNKTFNKEKIQLQLKTILPDYMVPNLWVELTEMPLTSNGKINKNLLPAPNGAILSKNKYVSARNDIEKRLVVIWQKLLEVDTIGIHDHFFELGGHSLLATRLVSMIRKEFEIEVAIQNVFKFTTINEIACYLEHKQYNLQYKKKEYSINIEI